MGANNSTSTDGTQEWEINVKAYRTVTYKIKKGDLTILKQTGSSPNNGVSYSVNVRNGEMSLIKGENELIHAGHDGDIGLLVSILKSMVSEIESHIQPSTSTSKN